MGAHSVGVLVVAAGVLGVLVWLLAKLGRLLAGIAEAVAAAAVLFMVLRQVIRAMVWALRQAMIHWRTSCTLVAGLTWSYWLGWISLVVIIGAVVVSLAVWRLADLMSFDRWAGRYLRAWWLHWTLYTRHLPAWLHACGLSMRDDALPVVVTVNLIGRKKIHQDRQASAVHVPKVLAVKSGPSWDEVRVRLVPGQKPEDYDEAARALASARKVTRCQVREIKPHVVSIDFQQRNLLADAVTCRAVGEVEVDVRRVWSGRTEYGQDWHVSLAGSHTLVAGSTGAGKNSVMWCPLMSIAPAIRDGLVRVSGIDPKGMELAYGRGIFHRYAVTGADALAVLDDLVGAMNTRKREFAGRVRSVPITTDHPLEILEFDEIGALTKYTDRKTREAITERVALLTTQGRALGFTVRGYVQEPTKDTVPVRDLFPRRICLRVAAKSRVAMVLGDSAYERGAWANRIGESEAGVGYVFGEGVREPLRVRAGWVPDETIKQLEAFVSGGTVRAFPTLPDRRGEAA
jgi:S-DNA-T family DNA segregation ATPase FtsK/SpoIIIE